MSKLSDFIKRVFNKKKKPVSKDTYQYSPKDTRLGEPSEWSVKTFASPDKALKITITFLSGVMVKYCMVVFSNEKTRQYKLVAPWIKEEIIDWHELLNFSCDEISRDLLPDIYKK